MAADVVGYSKLMEQDETGTLSLLKAHRIEVFEPVVAKHRGRIFKLIGDGALVEFSSAVDAVECAVEIQQRLLQEANGLVLRVGVNLGDVIVDGDDIYGDGVNVAARLEAIAKPGGVCLSGTAYDMVSGKVGCEFEGGGAQRLKNISKPLRVYHCRFEADDHSPTEYENHSEEKRQSIAVLPFSNMSGDPEQEYFSDGITEDIITDLSKVSGLFVISRNSTFSYKGQSIKIQQISSDLGAKYLVEGSVRRSGNRVRVTAQLIDGGTGGHVWAERYDRDLLDVFEVQDDVTRNIVDALKVAIAPMEKQAIARVPTTNFDAYDLCLQGRNLLYEMNRENLEKARHLFERAVELDPDYSLALSGLADCESTIYQYYSSDQTFIEAAISNCNNALALDPDLPEAHASLGIALFLRGSYCEAERMLGRALELDPMLYEAFWNLGFAKLLQNDFEAAAAAYTKASKVRGDDLQSHMMLMNCLSKLGRKEELVSMAQKSLSIAKRRLKLNEKDAPAIYVGAFAHIYVDQLDQAGPWLQQAAEIDSTDPRTSYNLACAFSKVGNVDKAIELLKQSIQAGRPIRMLDWALVDPDLAQARKDPRFDEVIKFWQSKAKENIQNR
nr:tetratricopeptide repeat protein [Ruegeria arenilitoris]